MLLLKLSEMRMLQLCTFLLEVSDFQTFCIWWAIHLVMVGVNVSIEIIGQMLAEFSLPFGGWVNQRVEDYLVVLR